MGSCIASVFMLPSTAKTKTISIHDLERCNVDRRLLVVSHFSNSSLQITAYNVNTLPETIFRSKTSLKCI